MFQALLPLQRSRLRLPGILLRQNFARACASAKAAGGSQDAASSAAAAQAATSGESSTASSSSAAAPERPSPAAAAYAAITGDNRHAAAAAGDGSASSGAEGGFFSKMDLMGTLKFSVALVFALEAMRWATKEGGADRQAAEQEAERLRTARLERRAARREASE
eukprot:TRINITY_DN26471_c0_g1_i1.p1 TRINITY_DN26471_c0_g1~~TRINITY_DN26471_c0_g1_i1.p1  ORF type:complete len:164 (+),score=40.82 TRINITY_DN26471_c0_g1_i1:79-570(+)